MICNAGVTDPKTCVKLRDLAMEDYMHTFNINYFCPVVMTKEALPHLEKTKGSIVHVSSTLGKKHRYCYLNAHNKDCWGFNPLS